MLLARYLRTLAEQNGVSSVHVNFCTKEEAAVFAQAGFHHRTGLQYHWHNNAPPAANASASTELTHTPRPYRDFDDFLGGFRSKKRLKIRRERQAVGAELDMEEVRGEEITPELLSLAFHMYKRTVDQRLLGRQYLNEKFFMMLAERYRHRLCLILVRRRTDGQLIAATLNVQKDDVFYGRYWGSSHKRQFLHFEACYYTPIQLAIEVRAAVASPHVAQLSTRRPNAMRARTPMPCRTPTSARPCAARLATGRSRGGHLRVQVLARLRAVARPLGALDARRGVAVVGSSARGEAARRAQCNAAPSTHACRAERAAARAIACGSATRAGQRRLGS